MTAGGATAPASTGDLLEARAGAVAVLTLDRPARRNALTRELVDELATALRRLEGDPGVRAVVLAGSGGAFCSGADLKAESIGARRLLEEHYNPLIETMVGLDLPIVAAVEGPAAGAGASLALACDLRVAAAGARFQLSFVKVGLVPDAGATWLLPRLVGAARAAELALLARDLGAEEARAWGLVTDVVAPGECLGAATSMAQRLAAMSSSTGAAKRALLDGAHASLRDHLAYEAAVQHRLQQHPDFAEARAAFREGRAPVFAPREVARGAAVRPGDGA